MSGWTPSTPHSHRHRHPLSSSLFTLTLLALDSPILPSTLLPLPPNFGLTNPPTPPPHRASRQTCTQTHTHFAPSWTHRHTRTHAYTSTPPVNQSPECHAVTDTVGEKGRTMKKNGSKSGPSLTLSLSAPSGPPLWAIAQRGTRKECEGSKWEGDREGEESGGVAGERWMQRRVKVSPFSHWPTSTKSQAGHSTGVAFFCLGLPSIPTPQACEVTPPVTPPRLFPVALSALIVADWLNGWKPKWRGWGWKKKWKRKRRRVRIWEKGWPGWKTPPLLFPEITDYLTQINNLTPPKEVAGVGGGGGRGFRGFEVRVVGWWWWDSALSVIIIVVGGVGVSQGREESEYLGQIVTKTGSRPLADSCLGFHWI